MGHLYAGTSGFAYPSWKPEFYPAKLPADIKCASEFRNNTWLMDEVYRLLEQHGVALCLAESEKFEVPQVITASFVYVRLRKEDYSAAERAELAERVRTLTAERDVYVFFKHEDTPAGAVYAEELLKVGT